MTGSRIEFEANGAAQQAYCAVPASGRGPGLLVLQEWWGLVPHIEHVCDRFAQAGFCALAPDLYGGAQTDKADEGERKMMALNIADTAQTLRAASQYLVGRDEVISEQVGIVGFCMGGQLALYSGCAFPESIAAVVNFYGVHPRVSPNLDTLRAPVLAHFGSEDPFVPPADAQALLERFKQAGKHIKAHFYEAGHAFFNDTRPEAFHPGSAALAWQRSLDFLQSHLAQHRDTTHAS